MTITITDAEGDIEEIRAAIVTRFIEMHGESLGLVSAQQACGIFDLTMNSFNDLGIDKVDLLDNGRVIRYKLADLEAKIAERTIKAPRRKARRQPVEK